MVLLLLGHYEYIESIISQAFPLRDGVVETSSCTSQESSTLSTHCNHHQSRYGQPRLSRIHRRPISGLYSTAFDISAFISSRASFVAELEKSVSPILKVSPRPLRTVT